MEELRMVVHQLEEEVVIKDKEIKQKDVRIKELEERLEYILMNIEWDRTLFRR